MASRGIALSRSCRCLAGRVTSTWPPRYSVAPSKRWLSNSSPARANVSGSPQSYQIPYTLPLDSFPRRHIGPSREDEKPMLTSLDPPVKDLDIFIEQTLPVNIRLQENLKISSDEKPNFDALDKDLGGVSESFIAARMKEFEDNILDFRSYIGAGYANTRVPGVIQRNVLENPAWYTSYTPYQAEIAQGRLESLLNFQTLTTDLTGLKIANASVLDEGTAAAEAMTLSMNSLPATRQKRPGKVFLVSHLCHPQTIAVLESRATGFGIKIRVGDILENARQLVSDQGEDLIGVLAQYPDTEGGVHDFQSLADKIHELGATFCVATDLLALTVLKAPGEFGADIAFGNSQRLGVPLGYGGPHAAFFACGEKYKRKIPGRLVGVSKDRIGGRALRLALQTREQHIRREKATSNICTAQALLANMSAMYAVYHGPEGLKAIAEKIRGQTRLLQNALMTGGWKIATSGTREDGAVLFDTLIVEAEPSTTKDVMERGARCRINFRRVSDSRIGITLDETTALKDLQDILSAFQLPQIEASKGQKTSINVEDASIPAALERTTPFLQQAVFNRYHSETELLRYIYYLQAKDLSLVHSMISLGSCTMKLNATTEMVSIGSPKIANLHPFAPLDQTQGLVDLARYLGKDLAVITGMHEVSLQPNSGAQGEFTGLRVIKKYLDLQNSGQERNICLIPVSAHGTNPASAAMAGMKVVPLKCDLKTGNLDIKDLKEKCAKHKDDLAAIMVTYPSTFGVFEPQIKEVCQIVHEHGGQVYMDGANLNAQIGLCNPGEIGADVCHLNLHKTFCIPHGGGGPGVGPIGVKAHLAEYLPTHPMTDPHSDTRSSDSTAISPVSAAPWGSASLLPISYTYIKMMGGPGLTHQTKIALLNANYIMSRLRPHYNILYTNEKGRCAHEFILDVRPFKASCGIEAIDVAKRLQDYGFHAPTMSWPVANTLMIEPTESESKEELDRFCDALISIRGEITDVEDGKVPKEGNILKMAPHPMVDLLGDSWDRPYSREQAAYPLPWLKEKKFWPSVARVDDAYGDTNLFCTCDPVEGSEDLTGAAAPTPT